MSESSNWVDLGFTEKFISNKVTSIKIDKTSLAIIYKDGNVKIGRASCRERV